MIVNEKLDRTLLAELSDLIAERLGLHFPEERWPDLTRNLCAAGRKLGFEHPDTCLDWLKAGDLTSRQIETLASHLTVGETYFFRDPASFATLENEILPPLIAQRAEAGRTLRLWSTGCCSGEEAYSLAIACSRALPDYRKWNVSILASDINLEFLAKAEAGVYSEWSFRGAPGWLRERFFSPTPDKKFAIDPTIKSLVHFDYLNLAEDVFPSLHNHTNAMDVIFCRNVLMYFTPGHQRRVVAALHRCLVEGGCLLVNPAEASTTLFPMFAVENNNGVILFRKASHPTRKASWPDRVPPLLAPPVTAPEAAFTAQDEVPVTIVPVAPALPIMPTAAPPRENPLVLARACADQGRLEEAFASCRDAIAAEPTNAAAYLLAAVICQELGHVEDAIAALGKVLYLDQDFILAHHALAGLYKQLGKDKESRRHLAIALELLAARSKDEIVPDSDGMTCGRLVESVRAMTGA